MTNQKLELELLPDEHWWGGRAADGRSMPYGMSLFEADLAVSFNGNQACPLLISSKGRYVWSDEPFAFQFDRNRLLVSSDAGGLVAGEGNENLRGAYSYVSRTFFPPAATVPEELLFTAPQYNLWIELLYEPAQDKVLQYAKDALAQGMPPGVIMIDDNWHEPYGTWTFHSGRFPDPKGMVQELHAMGFKVMLWVCPFVSPDSLTFRQIEKRGILLKDSGGKTALRRWWNGFSAVLDCTNPAAVAWMREQMDALQREYGIDGFKLDAGDPEFYEPDDLSYVPGTTRNGHCEAWAKVGLKYRLNEYRACWKLAGQPLVQRLMDKNHEWTGNGLDALIPDGLAQGLLGYAFTCPDMIGGGQYSSFSEERLDQELFVRYAQCSALFPMMQFSAAPWRLLSEQNQRYCVEAAQLHVRFGDEILGLARHAAVNGEPILRHMAYVFPEEGMESVQDQFMLGDSLLVAPVIAKGARARDVLFPAGNWLGDDGSMVHGPAKLQIDVPLGRLPWYRKQ
ncbi:glycoside hydrolase family 31 protein [Paenibacillus sp. J5C_2022]|uniref:glycoside hydrolase family 31 protein n=1 Tax=Paenibacillus sp. J5C2022 TaxID=2977129 RepID=UPI0021D146FC|nr:glycoside hydrolase family 31 protein [Paenibacillus sp. J5C2022]MCU6712583.1 glycoside hydrolase family 31 protein [Paenibacillus sp. J5C2022]